MRELTFHDVIRIFKKRFIILIIIVALAMGITAAISFQQPNEYTAQTVLYILQSYEDGSGYTRYEVSSSTSFAADYYELIMTENVLKRTADVLGVDSLDDVEIQISSTSGTRVLKVSVIAPNRSYAIRAVNALCSVFVDYIGTITNTNTVIVASEASYAEQTGPARVRNTLLVGIGAAFIAAFAFLAIEMLDNSFREESEILDTLNISVLASVPNTKKEMKEYYSTGRKSQRSLYYSVSENTREGIQTLVANMRFVTQGANVKKILVSSTVPKEGKTSTSVMLATALAQYDKYVCVVDMDYRNPSVERALKMKGHYGLYDYLNGKVELKEVVNRTNENGVFFVSISPQSFHMNQIFSSEKFEQFCTEMAENFDYVIFDTPPIGLYIDAALLAPQMDGVLMVIGRGRSDRKGARSALEQFKKAQANVLGAVMTFAGGPKNNHYYYGNYKNYGKDKLNVMGRIKK